MEYVRHISCRLTCERAPLSANRRAKFIMGQRSAGGADDVSGGDGETEAD